MTVTSGGWLVIIFGLVVIVEELFDGRVWHVRRMMGESEKEMKFIGTYLGSYYGYLYFI